MHQNPENRNIKIKPIRNKVYELKVMNKLPEFLESYLIFEIH